MSSDFYNNLQAYLADPSKEVIINAGASFFSNSETSWELYDMDGALYYSSTGGHAMSVTALLENGDLIVSSWGKKYRLHTEDYSEIYRSITIVDYSS